MVAGVAASHDARRALVEGLKCGQMHDQYTRTDGRDTHNYAP